MKPYVNIFTSSLIITFRGISIRYPFTSKSISSWLTPPHHCDSLAVLKYEWQSKLATRIMGRVAEGLNLKLIRQSSYYIYMGRDPWPLHCLRKHSNQTHYQYTTPQQPINTPCLSCMYRTWRSWMASNNMDRSHLLSTLTCFCCHPILSGPLCVMEESKSFSYSILLLFVEWMRCWCWHWFCAVHRTRVEIKPESPNTSEDEANHRTNWAR